MRPLLLLAFVILLYWRPMFFQGHIPLFGNLFFHYHPAHVLAAEFLQEGCLPAWNPYSGAGQPFIADPQISLFSPISLPFWFFHFPVAIKLFFLFVPLLCGFFGFLVCFEFSRSFKASYLCAVLSSLNMFTMNHLGMLNQIQALVWMPAVLLFSLALFKGGRGLWPAIFLGVTLTMQLLGHYPPFSMAASLLVLLAMGLFWSGCDRLNVLWRLAGALGVAFLLSSCQTLPFLEYFWRSDWASGLDYSGAVKYSLPPLYFLKSLFIPPLFGKPVEGDPSLMGHYMGVLTVPLIAIFLAKAPKRAAAFFLAAIGVSLLLSFGEYLPFYKWLFSWIKPIGWVRYPSQWLCIWTTLVPVAMGLGFRFLRGAAWRGVLPILCVLDLAILGRSVPYYFVRPDFYYLSPLLIERDSGFSNVLHTAEFKREVERSAFPEGQEEKGWLRFKALAVPNSGWPFHITQANPYGVLGDAPYKKLLEEMGSDAGFLNFLNAGYWFGKAAEPRPPWILQGKVEQFQILKAPEDFPIHGDMKHPAWFQYRLELKSDGWAAFPHRFYPGWKAYVDGNRVPVSAGGPSGLFVQVPVGAGPRDIRLRFFDPALKWGISLTLLGLFSLLAGGLWKHPTLE